MTSHSAMLAQRSVPEQNTAFTRFSPAGHPLNNFLAVVKINNRFLNE
jgi:hypothetical protein